MARKPVRKRKPRIVFTRGGDREEIKAGLKRFYRYRDKSTGQFKRKPRRITKKVRRELYEYRTSTMGQFTSGRLVSLEKTETKKLGTIDLDNWDGHVKNAMMASNIFTTVQKRNAKMVDIFIQGYDGKTRIVIKKSLDLSDIHKRYEIGDMMVAKIIERLHAMGYRTEYDIQKIRDWTKRLTKRREASAYKPLRNVMLTFRIRY